MKSFKNDALSTGALGTDCSEPETKQCIRMDLNKMRGNGGLTCKLQLFFLLRQSFCLFFYFEIKILSVVVFQNL